MAFSYIYKHHIFLFLTQPLQNLQFQFVHLKVYDKFVAYVKISFFSGIFLSFPFIIYQISRFVLPALYLNEKKFYFISLLAIIILFFLGIFFSYKLLVPMSLKFLMQFDASYSQNPQNVKQLLEYTDQQLILSQKKLNNILQNYNPSSNDQKIYTILQTILNNQKNIHSLLHSYSLKSYQNDKSQIQSYLSVSEYVNWIVFFILMTGIIFQTPFLISLLAKAKIVHYTQLSKSRPFALIFILILSAFMTPPDILSQIILAIPIYLLYEISIISAKIISKYSH